MKYKNGNSIFPKELLKEIQKYACGEYIYIPCASGDRKGWGEKTGNRQLIANRNKEIYEKYKLGYTYQQLSENYFLSYDSIKKIIYSKK